MPELIDTAEAAKRLGVSVRRIRAMISEGKLPARKVGRDHIISAGDLATVTVYRKAGRPPKAK